MDKHLKQGDSVVVFRHFSRKPYSLFTVLSREVRIGVLAIATLSAAAPCMAQSKAQKPALARAKNDTTHLAAAEVLASRIPMAANVAARQVTTLGRDDIAAAGVTTVNDALKNSVGVDVRQRGAFGIQTDISINGGTFDQVSYLINGFPVNNAQTGHNAADFPLSLSDISRVQIIEGAATRGFGSQAFSGAINLITRRPGAGAYNNPALTLRTEGGSYGTFRNEARIAQRIHRFGFTLSHSMQRSDGAVPNSDFKTHRTFWTGDLDLPRFSLQTQAGAVWSEYGANTFYTAAFPNQWEATRRFMVGARGEVKLPVRIIPQISWVRNLDHFQLMRNVHKYENFHNGNIISGNLSFRKDWKHGVTTVGSELRYEDILSSNLGLPLDSSEFVRARLGSGYYTHKDHRTNISVFAEQTFVWNQWSLSAGLSGEKNTSIKGGMRFYPGLDVSYRPTAQWQLFASVNRSMRLPTFTDLYYKSPTQEGNKNLRAEENTTYRLGANFESKAITVQAAAFYNRGNHMIDWVMRDAKDKFHATSFDLDNLGATLMTHINFDHLLGKQQPLQALTLGYAYIHQHRRDDAAYFKSNYALEYLRHKFTANLSHRIVSHLSADWNLRLQQREGNYLIYAGNKSTGQLHPYGTHAILDLKVKWSRPAYDVYVSCMNLTNTHYYDLGNVRQPGAVFMVGATLRIPQLKLK